VKVKRALFQNIIGFQDHESLAKGLLTDYELNSQQFSKKLE
jgi:hypothetical protein